MRSHFVRCVHCAACLAVFAAEGPARADAVDEGAPPADEATDLPPPPPPAPAAPDRWSIGVNPLAAIGIGRYGGDGEWLAAPHWALVANLHVDFAEQAVAADYGSLIYGFGGEVGARVYSTPGLFGVFLGVSAVSGCYSVEYYGNRFALPDVGFALDFGGKARLGKGGMFMAVGLGVQDLWTTTPYPKDIGQATSFVLGAGVAPRLLMTLGTVIR